jgi:hypothetical protein
MEKPSLSPSCSSPAAADPSGFRGHVTRSRIRLIFWLISSLVILPLLAANIDRWVQEARREADRKELRDLWPEVFRILERSTSMDLIALNPEGVVNEAESFHGYGVLGRATIHDAGDIKALAAGFVRGRREGGDVVLCFEPRHGIRVRHGEQDLDLVICFQCKQGYLYHRAFRKWLFVISGSPRETFDQIFKKSGLRIAQ